MKPEEQGVNECDYCYLQRLKTLAQNAGLSFRLMRARTGKHRQLKGFDIRIQGEKVAHLKELPKECTCNAK